LICLCSVLINNQNINNVKMFSCYNKTNEMHLFLKFSFGIELYMNVKFVSAKQAEETYQYRNTKEKFYKTKAAIWCNKICSEFHREPASKQLA
jgi:hypothetical protein